MLQGTDRSSRGRSHYGADHGVLVHELEIGSLSIRAEMAAPLVDGDAKGSWWRGYIEGRRPRAVNASGGRLRVVDLFCGCGGLANGIAHLCDEMGVAFVSELAADEDEHATAVYAANHGTRLRAHESIRHLIDYGVRLTPDGARFTYRPEILDEDGDRAIRGADLLVAGPPCQGHSNLNNSTRRSDPRNSLYLTVPAIAVAAGTPICIIENVPAIVRDRHRVVETAVDLFEADGYHVACGVLSASEMGWPQTRRRHFLIARKDRPPIAIGDIAAVLIDEPRPLWWMIRDLEDAERDPILDQPSELSAANRARVEWLFRNDQYDLALDIRPDSHRAGTTYMAVYGRLRKDQPAPTITGGFMTPGRGRFTHPTRPRALTPREGARLQGFPDTYRFTVDPCRPPTRSLLAKWIGSAVPMPLAYAAALSALGPGLPRAVTEAAQ